MAVTVKDSSGSSTKLSVRLVDIADLENAGVSDFLTGSTTCYQLDLDNSANGAITYFRAYNNATPTYGTTDPDLMIMVAASTRQVWNIAQGLTMSAGMSVQASSNDGPGSATGADPSSAFNASLVVSA